MRNAIFQQRGSPQNNVAWDEPDKWIVERLSGESRELALKIWNGTEKRLNPRYLRGAWYLAKNHELLEEAANGRLSLTAHGRAFLDEEFHLLSKIEASEGIIDLLQMVADCGPSPRADLLVEFAPFCRKFTTFQADISIQSMLWERLGYLVGREFVQKANRTYEVTEKGTRYLQKSQSLLVSRNLPSKQDDLLKIAREIRSEVRANLLDQLSSMAPYKFEQLIKLLLERMGYEDVKVTMPSNDKGVDVIGDIQVGISRRREVVQVKRHKGNISRPVLDSLRGSLHRFDGVQGTIITTGGFAKGAENAAVEKGAAPITLIDGERLLDLLEEFEIGVKKRSVVYIELDPTDLNPYLDDAVAE